MFSWFHRIGSESAARHFGYHLTQHSHVTNKKPDVQMGAGERLTSGHKASPMKAQSFRLLFPALIASNSSEGSASLWSKRQQLSMWTSFSRSLRLALSSLHTTGLWGAVPKTQPWSSHKPHFPSGSWYQQMFFKSPFSYFYYLTGHFDLWPVRWLSPLLKKSSLGWRVTADCHLRNCGKN